MPKHFLRNLAFAFLLAFSLQSVQAQNVGIGTPNPLERLHVAGAVRVNTLAGVGTRVVGSDVNGTLVNIAPGTNGQVLTQTAAGPVYQTSAAAPLSINSTTLTADIQVTGATWANVPGMTVTFTATQADAMIMFSASGFAFTNSMAYVQFRVLNGATSFGGTNTKMQSYDDVTGTVTAWSCTYTRAVTGLTVGSTYTYTVQGQVAGILGTPNAADICSIESGLSPHDLKRTAMIKKLTMTCGFLLMLCAPMMGQSAVASEVPELGTASSKVAIESPATTGQPELKLQAGSTNPSPKAGKSTRPDGPKLEAVGRKVKAATEEEE